MGTATQPLFTFDNTFVRELTGLYEPWQAAPASAPRLLALNAPLARELGVDPEALASPEGVAALLGVAPPQGADPVAQAYAGHQFGGLSPRLGDGRALLLGEIHDTAGRRRDLHLKGSGRTPFSRGGDGKAAVGPMLREYVIGEAMHALGIPTSRALAVIATGDDVRRETLLPGAVLVRVAASHLRVGTFEYAAREGDPALLRRLADYAIARHHPAAAAAGNPYLALLASVADAQAELIAQWMLVGFVHGVMNTDNMAISGESIDYGPCAFMEAYDPATKFSSIDHGGRYAYGNQPLAAQWNLARFAEALLALIDDDAEAAIAAATPVLTGFMDTYAVCWRRGMRAKVGLREAREGDDALFGDLLERMEAGRVDWTSGFRGLSGVLRGGSEGDAEGGVYSEGFDAWIGRWQERLAAEGTDPGAAAEAMDRVNPIYVARNRRVEEALTAATSGDMGPCEALVEVLRAPFEVRLELERYAEPAPEDEEAYVTFCGT